MMSYDAPDSTAESVAVATYTKLTQTGFIRNMAYYSQRVAFNEFPLKAQDVDMEIDLDGQAFIRAEFKYSDSPVPMGQQVAAKSWCRAVGVKKSAFFVVARHTVEAPEDVPTDALQIDCVYYKTPDMRDYQFHRYNGHDVPTFTQFLTTIAVSYGLYRYLDYEKAEMDRWWPFDPVFSAAYDCKQAQQLREVSNKQLCNQLGIPYSPSQHESSSAMKRRLLAENPPDFRDYMMKLS